MSESTKELHESKERKPETRFDVDIAMRDLRTEIEATRKSAGVECVRCGLELR